MAACLSLAAIESDRMAQLALRHLVEIVGEAADRVSRKTQEDITAIPWSKVVGMRNRIIHGYDKVDLALLWDTIVEDLPPLIKHLDEAIARLEREGRK